MMAMRLSRQAAVGEGSLERAELPLPEPGPGEVRVDVRACGVCRTDLHIVEGDLPAHRLPVVPGHQIVGVVSKLGPDVRSPALGARVGAGWLRSACGACDYCGRGLENLCPRARFNGYDADGGYAQSVTLPADFVFPIPERFADDEAAPLLCAGVIGYRSLRLAGAEAGGAVGLFGFGASAHLALQVARRWKARVFVSTRGEEHRRVALELGAEWAGEGRPPEPLESAVVFAPSGDAVLQALESVRPGATVAINAIHLDRLPEMPYETLYGERTLKSVTNFTRRDAREFLDLAASSDIRVEREVLPLEKANEALLRLKRRALRAAAVLRVPS